jgi:hypothetical protein
MSRLESACRVERGVEFEMGGEEEKVTSTSVSVGVLTASRYIISGLLFLRKRRLLLQQEGKFNQSINQLVYCPIIWCITLTDIS